MKIDTHYKERIENEVGNYFRIRVNVVLGVGHDP